MGKIGQIVKANLGILALFMLFGHFFLIWNYAAPEWSRIKKAEGIANFYVNPLFIQNFRLFAPATVHQYKIEWRKVGASEWESDFDKLNDAHDQWKFTSSYQENVGTYNMLYWIYVDFYNRKFPSVMSYDESIKNKNYINSNARFFINAYSNFKLQDEPAGFYQFRCVFENKKEKTTETFTVIVKHE